MVSAIGFHAKLSKGAEFHVLIDVRPKVGMRRPLITGLLEQCMVTAQFKVLKERNMKKAKQNLKSIPNFEFPF